MEDVVEDSCKLLQKGFLNFLPRSCKISGTIEPGFRTIPKWKSVLSLDEGDFEELTEKLASSTSIKRSPRLKMPS